MSISRRSARNRGNHRDARSQMTDTVRAWWSSLTRREHILISLAGAIVCVYLLWTFTIEQALNTITQAHQQLPQLRSDAALVGAIALEVKAAGSRPTGGLNPASLPAALQQSLDDSGLTDHASIQTMPDDALNKGWILTIADAPTTKLMPWLASLSNIMPIKIRRVQLDRSQRAGRDYLNHVSGKVEIAFSGEQSP